MAFFNDFKDRVNKAAQSVSNKTKDSMEISRLTSEGRGINAELEGLFTQIGRTYVESKGEASESLSALCARVDELNARLEELEVQKLLLKNQNVCPACGAVMAKDARFCSNCGEKMPEPPVIEPEPEEPAPEEAEAESAAEVTETEPAATEPAEEAPAEEAPNDAE